MTHSLRVRLTVVFGGLTLLAVALFALVVAGVLEQLLIGRLTEDLTVQANLVAGRVAADLAREDASAVQQALTELDSQTAARILVVDTRRRQLGASEAGDRHALGLPSERAGLARALEGETVQTVPGRGSADPELLYVAVPVQLRGRIVGAARLAYQLEDLEQTLTRLNLAIGLGALVTASLAGILAAVFAASVSAPVQALSRATRALAEGDLGQHVTVRTHDEVGALGEAFNSLAARLAELETARQELAADVSHELRALAGAMQTAIDALASGADRDPELRDELMAGLTGHADRLVRLADDLRELGRIDGGQLTTELKTISLASVARQAASEWAAEVARRNVHLEVEADDDTFVDGDRQRLVQACGNLIENALKYAASGGWIGVHATAGATSHTLAVADNGPGIPAVEIASIFRRSYRVEGRTGEGPGGMGLGLAIVDRIVRAHGGTVTATSDQGEGGAIFTIRLPACNGLHDRASTALPAGALRPAADDSP
jgi:signal transduction histidine kinase